MVGFWIFMVFLIICITIIGCVIIYCYFENVQDIDWRHYGLLNSKLDEIFKIIKENDNKEKK